MSLLQAIKRTLRKYSFVSYDINWDSPDDTKPLGTNTISSVGQTPPYYLMACAIVRNEGPYLREWLEFHAAVGVQKFLVYDDGSEDETQMILSKYVERGIVEYIRWPRFLKNYNNQFLAYMHAMKACVGRTKWLAIIDADEFLFSPERIELTDVLKGYEDLPAIAVYSRTFGPSRHSDRPHGLVIENYTLRADDGYHKNFTHRSIVQPGRIRGVRSANSVHILNEDAIIAYDEGKNPVFKTGEPGHTVERLRINHYFTKSRAEFERKISRKYFGKTRYAGKMNQRRQELRELEQFPVEDRVIGRFLPELRRRLEERPDR